MQTDIASRRRATGLAPPPPTAPQDVPDPDAPPPIEEPPGPIPVPPADDPPPPERFATPESGKFFRFENSGQTAHSTVQVF